MLWALGRAVWRGRWVGGAAVASVTGIETGPGRSRMLTKDIDVVGNSTKGDGWC